ncbi:MAG: M20/M25/M40 family metallo-hydrolase [Eubacteriales bacterium]|nr:M20/M25/M40 family metallo-hydrolase [Eubacteriales bacterium]
MGEEQDIIKIQEKAEAYAPKQLELLKKFASFDSVTGYEEGNREVIRILKEELGKLRIDRIDEEYFEGTGTHLIARIIPEHPDGRILLNAHMDTVFPVGYTAANPPSVEGDWLHGLGTTDCKAGFVISCYAVRIMQELGLLPNLEIDMIYSCDEEIGSPTAQKVFEKESKGADAVFIFEGEQAEMDHVDIITARKGVILGSMDVKGVEAHAGIAYMDGHSAIRELAGKIIKYYNFNDYENQIYYNVAPISGGRPNGVVAGDAHMEFCVAGLRGPEDFKTAEANLDSLTKDTEDPGCSVSIAYHTLFPACIRTEQSGKLVDLTAKAGDLLGMKVVEKATPGAADAAWFSSFGIPAALDGYGAVGKNIHTTDECLYIPCLPKKTELFAATLLMLREYGLPR